ncbi:uncharacterized protein [Montipora capricornis]|uniref:uncharacterized protein n=1 Tax=Montipora capricornis TaxID=246305 RepID=UPI0035F1C1A9
MKIGEIILPLLRTVLGSYFRDRTLVTHKQELLVIGAVIGTFLFLYIAYWTIRRALIACFPVAYGHRRFWFSGRSSKPLREILLSVDSEIPTEEKLQEFKEKALLYLNDVKIALEEAMSTTTFQFIFSGSAVDRFGIPVMMSVKKKSINVSALYTDLDVMFCSLKDKASFADQENILIAPFFTESEVFTGYAYLKSLTPAHQGMCVSSQVIIEQALGAVLNTRLINLPSYRLCGIDLPSQIEADSKGPAMKLHIPGVLEADITLCVQCREWPIMSDWASRPRYWPSVVEAQRIMSLGCHLVAKPAPSDKEKTSWRFSFSLGEVELSKLVPDTARKCFLALKIILKDHFQPVVPEITSYHMKTIFYTTLEKVPVGFWIESNIEECFLTLLAEVLDALLSVNCPHHWFSSINLFDMEAKNLQRLAKKVQRIMQDPAPFILDDCWISLASFFPRVPYYHFTCRNSEQFRAEYDEFTQSADGRVIVDPGDHSYQLPCSRVQCPSLCSTPDHVQVEFTAKKRL